MKSLLILLLSLVLFVIPCVPATECQAVANYQIKAELDPATQTVSGKLQLDWTHTGNQPVSDLYFHAYLNAFRNSNSTLLKECALSSPDLGLFDSDWPENGWGSQDVESISASLNGAASVDLTGSMVYVQPDDNNSQDMTVFKVDLDTPVNPGEMLTIDIRFSAKLPYKGIRAGFKEDFFMAGQWFPKIGVLTDAGWNCHQYHNTSEFFADFGNYHVELTVPKGYVVGATGVMTDSTFADGKSTVVFEQDCVHDFAFTASPLFKVKNMTVGEGSATPVKVRLLYLADHEKLTARYLDAAEHAILHFNDWFLPYPYPQLTIVDVPFTTYTGSMEYPTLITARSSVLSPDGDLGPEWVIMHEYAHQYWYGLVATNEFEFPWMDEGFTSFFDVRCLNASYGFVQYGHTWLERSGFAIPLTMTDIEFNPLNYRLNRLRNAQALQPVNIPAWQYTDYAGYKAHAYDKAALMMATLENLLGTETFSAIIKEYVGRYQYKHPGPADFVGLVNEMAPQSMDWFFKQILDGPEQLDYAVQSIVSLPQAPARGLDNSGKLIQAAKADIETFHSKVVISRKGGLVIPVEIRIEFENGETDELVWDGVDASYVLEYTGGSPVMKVVVDPDQKLVLDMDYSNNTRYRERNSYASYKWSARFLLWLQHLLETAASLS